MTRPIDAARFWIRYRGSFVRLTMRAGDTIALSSYVTTDEGYRDAYEEYSFDGAIVRVDGTVIERDCDGLTRRDSSHTCPIGRLASHAIASEPGIGFPDWIERSLRARDYTAESMGY